MPILYIGPTFFWGVTKTYVKEKHCCPKKRAVEGVGGCGGITENPINWHNVECRYVPVSKVFMFDTISRLQVHLEILTND